MLAVAEDGLRGFRPCSPPSGERLLQALASTCRSTDAVSDRDPFVTDQRALLLAFSDYGRTISGGYDIDEVLARLAHQVVEVLGLEGAGVALSDHAGELEFVTATDERISNVEARQFTPRGTVPRRFHSGDLVTSADPSAEICWLTYALEALAQGCKAVAGIRCAPWSTVSVR